MAAEQLLANPLLQEALNNLESDLLNQMRQARLDDKDGHTRLVMALQMSNAVKRHLWLLVQDGAAATQEIQLRGKRID